MLRFFFRDFENFTHFDFPPELLWFHINKKDIHIIPLVLLLCTQNIKWPPSSKKSFSRSILWMFSCHINPPCQLKEEIKWNQFMFSDHGTFIIGFSIAKEHIGVAPEAVVIHKYEKDIEEAGYSHAQELFRIKWTNEVDFELLDKIVAYNIEDKKGLTKFWR